MDLDWNARALGLLLGLGDLNPVTPCHGYANACVCLECVERQKAPKPAPVKQPWELAA